MNTTSISEYKEVVYQQFAPFTGCQQCKHCAGWIVGGRALGLNNDYPLCPKCFSAKARVERTRGEGSS